MIEISLSVVSPFVAMLLLFWFKTEFVPEYGKILGFKKLLAIDKYESSREYNPNLTYQTFIAMNYSRFFHRLINCTVCLGTWLSIVATGILSFVSGEYLFLTMIPLNAIVGILIYLLIRKLI